MATPHTFIRYTTDKTGDEEFKVRVTEPLIKLNIKRIVELCAKDFSSKIPNIFATNWVGSDSGIIFYVSANGTKLQPRRVLLELKETYTIEMV